MLKWLESEAETQKARHHQGTGVEGGKGQGQGGQGQQGHAAAQQGQEQQGQAAAQQGQEQQGHAAAQQGQEQQGQAAAQQGQGQGGQGQQEPPKVCILVTNGLCKKAGYGERMSRVRRRGLVRTVEAS